MLNESELKQLAALVPSAPRELRIESITATFRVEIKQRLVDLLEEKSTNRPTLKWGRIGVTLTSEEPLRQLSKVLRGDAEGKFVEASKFDLALNLRVLIKLSNGETRDGYWEGIPELQAFGESFRLTLRPFGKQPQPGMRITAERSFTLNEVLEVKAGDPVGSTFPLFAHEAKLIDLNAGIAYGPADFTASLKHGKMLRAAVAERGFPKFLVFADGTFIEDFAPIPPSRFPSVRDQMALFAKKVEAEILSEALETAKTRPCPVSARHPQGIEYAFVAVGDCRTNGHEFFYKTVPARSEWPSLPVPFRTTKQNVWDAFLSALEGQWLKEARERLAGMSLKQLLEEIENRERNRIPLEKRPVRSTRGGSAMLQRVCGKLEADGYLLKRYGTGGTVDVNEGKVTIFEIDTRRDAILFVVENYDVGAIFTFFNRDHVELFRTGKLKRRDARKIPGVMRFVHTAGCEERLLGYLRSYGAIKPTKKRQPSTAPARKRTKRSAPSAA